MKTIAYICSYETNRELSAKQLSKEKADINKFCKVHKITIDEIYTEITEKDDYKPVLLNIMSACYNKIQCVIITDFDVISRNKDFRDWVLDEFKRMKVEVICTNSKLDEPETPNKNLSSITENIKNIPSLPEIITKSIEIMQDKNTSAETLSKIISTDIGLTARVLKLVNSSYYGFPKQISTIKQAITILGFTTIKGIIISASVFKMFSDTSNNHFFNYKKFWKHSMLVAAASRLISQHSPTNKNEDIFSAAFLHDIGKIILARYDKDNYSKIHQTNIINENEYMILEEKYCGINHCQIGNLVAYAWNLPELFCEIITNHHTFDESHNYKKECAIVNLALKIVTSIESNESLNIDNITLDTIEKINVSEQNIISVYENLRETSTDIDDIDSFLTN